MAKITAADVNKLRKMTGAGMMDCKNALVEAEGDFDKAIEILRKKGQKVAAKRADRESSEGVVVATLNDDRTRGVLISLNCETDFVAKNEDFIKLAEALGKIALNYDTKEEFLQAPFAEGLTVADKITEQTGVIGEKLEIGAFEPLEGAYLGSYIHSNKKIGTLVAFNKAPEGIEEVAHNVAMQVAAMNPIALDEASVPQEIVDKELEIAKEQLRNEGKPENMLDKIAQGKLKKFFKESTLVNQAYIKDNKKTVGAYVKELDPELQITGFKRVALG
ncbi:MAG: elongation factor Ts [Chlorobi bacterium]|nr:elongation factor Ts [Chlorobiota bacterium]